MEEKIPSKFMLDWALIFSILQSLTEGGTGGRVKEKVKALSKGQLPSLWIGLKSITSSRSKLGLLFS